MNRLPDRQIDVDDPPRLGRIRRPRDGHVKTLTARVGGDEAELPQEFLQVAHEAWSVDDDVQAAVALRSCRNEVAFSHCRDEAAPVKGSQHDVDEQEQGSRRTFSRKRARPRDSSPPLHFTFDDLATRYGLPVNGDVLATLRRVGDHIEDVIRGGFEAQREIVRIRRQDLEPPGRRGERRLLHRASRDASNCSRGPNPLGVAAS